MYFYPTPNTEVPFTKGQVIVSKKGECHGAKNTGTEDIVFVSIVAPVPSDYDPVTTINMKVLYSIFLSCDRDIFIL